MKLFLIIIFSMVTVFAQKYNDFGKVRIYHSGKIDADTIKFQQQQYEKHVGNSYGMYPLTAQGLASAMAAIDSGTIVIEFPGLWDTSGVGAIKNTINIKGWLFGRYLENLSKGLTNTNSKFIWEQVAGQVPLLGLSSAYRFIGRQTSNDGLLSVENYFDKYGYINKAGTAVNTLLITAIDTSYNGGIPSQTMFKNILSYGGDSSSSAALNSGIRMQQNNFNYGQPYQPSAFSAITGIEMSSNWSPVSDTIQSTNGIKQFTSFIFNLGTNVRFNCPYYFYYSDPQGNNVTLFDKMINGNRAYHFYGKGDYPSYFGGSVIQKVYSTNVSTPPTASELNSSFPSAESGETVYIDDNNGHSNFYQCVKMGSDWIIFTGTKAL